MSLFVRFKFFIIGVCLGSILVFFFFGDKVKRWFNLYSSSGRVISHLMEPRYTLIYNQDTIADYLSVQGVFSILEDKQTEFDINLVAFDSLSQIEEPIKYIQKNINKIKNGIITIEKKNIVYTNQVLSKLGLNNHSDSSYNIIENLIKNSKIKILKRGDCYKYSLKNKYKTQQVEFIFESCDSVVKLIDFN
tara:strand:+ start:435 stop:1007 length:573 start_codon:yes stop_codon:yes gene_type:complete